MPRPANSIPSGVTVSTHQNPKKASKVAASPNDVLTIYADYACWNETQSKFVLPEDLVRS